MNMEIVFICETHKFVNTNKRQTKLPNIWCLQ